MDNEPSVAQLIEPSLATAQRDLYHGISLASALQVKFVESGPERTVLRARFIAQRA